MSLVKKYEWSDKLKACQLYLLNGNMRIVSEVTTIPYDTLSEWKRSDWWSSLVEEVRAIKRASQGVKMGDIITLSLEEVHDRLKNGDFVLNQKTGKMERRPVSLRDAATVTNNLLTRQLQMEEIADRMETTKVSVQETLNLIANEFKKVSKKPTNVIDVDFKETDSAIHDEWKTRLQKGSGELHEQAGSEEEEGSSERSTERDD